MLDTPIEIGYLELTILFFLNAVFLTLVFVVYDLIDKFNINIGFKFKINLNFFLVFYLFILIFNIIFTLITGSQVLFKEAQDNSFWGAIFSPFYIFPLFYIYCRNKINKYFFMFIVGLYCMSELIKGWTGFAMLIFTFELFYFLKGMAANKRIYACFIIPSAVLIAGGCFYYFLYPIKQSVRYGEGDYQITYFESINSLASRLTFFPVAVGGYQRSAEVKGAYEAENIELKETRGIFKPFLPSFLMNNKDFSPLNSNVKTPYFGVNPQTSSDIGGLIYLYLLFYTSPFDGAIVVFLAALMLIMTKVLYDMISDYRGQFSIIIYLCVFNMFYIFSPEHVFARNFLSILYILPLLIITGSVSVVRHTHSYLK